MDIEQLSTIVALLVALSVAAERLVEIIKNVVPFLRDEQRDDAGNIHLQGKGSERPRFKSSLLGQGLRPHS